MNVYEGDELLFIILFKFGAFWMQLYGICTIYAIMIIHGSVPKRFECATLCDKMERKCVSTKIMLRMYQCCACIALT